MPFHFIIHIHQSLSHRNAVGKWTRRYRGTLHTTSSPSSSASVHLQRPIKIYPLNPLPRPSCCFKLLVEWRKRRIMKRALPANGKIAKDAKETVQECVSEFISFITSEASDKCQREKRKTINGDDLLWAMSTLGFEDYIEPLKIYLHNYREMEGDNKGSSKSGADQSGKRDLGGPQGVSSAQQHMMPMQGGHLS
ncbi:hypothetical protein SUGI_0329540 [Cryptomeria japonica]|nr:hypothetical protein SUGI_0329540 [Cryptomeria japonica]